jgi:hypothetical protein
MGLSFNAIQGEDGEYTYELVDRWREFRPSGFNSFMLISFDETVNVIGFLIYVASANGVVRGTFEDPKDGDYTCTPDVGRPNVGCGFNVRCDRPDQYLTHRRTDDGFVDFGNEDVPSFGPTRHRILSFVWYSGTEEEEGFDWETEPELFVHAMVLTGPRSEWQEDDEEFTEGYNATGDGGRENASKQTMHLLPPLRLSNSLLPTPAPTQMPTPRPTPAPTQKEGTANEGMGMGVGGASVDTTAGVQHFFPTFKLLVLGALAHLGR